jgi:hypothetical protein
VETLFAWESRNPATWAERTSTPPSRRTLSVMETGAKHKGNAETQVWAHEKARGGRKVKNFDFSGNHMVPKGQLSVSPESVA